MTAVSRMTKYTTAMMQWNKRDHPFRFSGVGPSILNRRSGELLYLCLVNRNVLASFPGLPRFLFFGLRSVQYTEAEEREKRGRPDLIYHVRDVGGREVDVGGRGTTIFAVVPLPPNVHLAST